MRGRKRGEAGYTLVALLASMTIMLILMAAAMPSWRYVMKNDREEELKVEAAGKIVKLKG